MVAEVSGPNSNNITQVNDSQRLQQSQRGAGREVDQKPDRGDPATRQDSVNLTPTASRLQAVRDRIEQTPEVDQQRVDTLRRAIADGTYQPDAQRVADKLVQFEALMQGGGR
ncbi:MAG: flagellar biosynthesis anti-sigma factor FlgM [Gammaproteobacteria bacterium]|nr:MAG: flagellar biosynthesis anti-sigma factor FlgM [Gammaproteobacteria bacterium]